MLLLQVQQKFNQFQVRQIQKQSLSILYKPLKQRILSGIPYEHTGNKKSNILLIFLHGFPDSMRLWDQTITGIQKQDVQILNISYPNYHQSQNLKFGLDFPEVVKRIRSTIEHVDNGQNLKKLLITHDWGAFYGYLYDQKYPQTVDDIIALDVGAQVDLSLKPGLLIESYQITFAMAFLLTLIPIVGEFFGTLLAKLYMKFILRIPIPQNYTARINYQYFYFQKNLLFNSIFNKSKKFLYRYKPSVPVVFIYGEKKPFHFHSARWQLTLSQNADSEFIGAKTGHWIQVEQADLVINKIQIIMIIFIEIFNESFFGKILIYNFTRLKK